jgi:TatD DNase family protein
MYVDIHAHLDHEAFSDLAAVLARAQEAGVKAIIANGTNQASNERVRALCEQYPRVRAAYGLYPTEPDEINDAAVFAWIRNQAITGAHPPVAIGEIGLDGVEPVTERQRERFRAACALAQELRLPIIVHSRKAEQAVFDELEAMDYKGFVIMHCFGGSKKLVQEGVKRKYFFSIPAVIARATQFQMIAQLVPLSYLLTETDAPYLSAEKDGFPNEPASVVQTAAHIALIKKITLEECRQILFLNYQRLFARERS